MAPEKCRPTKVQLVEAVYIASLDPIAVVTAEKPPKSDSDREFDQRFRSSCKDD